MRPSAPRNLLVLLFASLSTAEPIAKPDALPQQITNNAPFSGAVYIVDGNGGQVSAQGTNYCPSSASLSCSNVGSPSWCCPANYACVSPANSNGLIGCCPSGNTCGGVVNQPTTVTVYPQQQQTAIVYANPPPQATVVVNNPPTHVQGSFCATITVAGPGLPRAEEGQCGTILLVAGASGLKVFGAGMTAIALILHVALGRMFHR